MCDIRIRIPIPVDFFDEYNSSREIVKIIEYACFALNTVKYTNPRKLKEDLNDALMDVTDLIARDIINREMRDNTLYRLENSSNVSPDGLAVRKKIRVTINKVTDLVDWMKEARQATDGHFILSKINARSIVLKVMHEPETVQSKNNNTKITSKDVKRANRFLIFDDE